MIRYHYNAFPPQNLDYQRLLAPLSLAQNRLARCDQMLDRMHNSQLLLSPWRQQEGVVSSRMEGTVSTLDDVLQYSESEQKNWTQQVSNIQEVIAHDKALLKAQNYIADGYPINDMLVRAMHEELMQDHIRGADKSSGEYKTEQNYLVDNLKQKILFEPVSPTHLPAGMGTLFAFIDDECHEILLRTALAHIEFEALHPFADGNGRIGRMLIPLMLWKYGALSQPHFYISAFFERHKDEYVDRMRAVSQSGDWTQWCVFFLQAIAEQAEANLKIILNIEELYMQLGKTFRDHLSSKWARDVLDFMMERPIFQTGTLAQKGNIGRANATRYVNILVDRGYLSVRRAPAGRRAGIYRFDALMDILQG